MLRMRATTSLRLWLSVYLGLAMVLLGLVTVVLSAVAALHEQNEIEDSRMSQLARTLLQLAPNLQATRMNTDVMELLPDGDDLEEDSGFAVWDAQGRLLTADEYGRDAKPRRTSGFVDTRALWREDAWRELYLHDRDSGYTVLVAQRWSERLAGLIQTLWIQLGVSLLLLPLLFILIHFGVRRGLRPLGELERALAERDAHSLSPVPEQVPQETLPLVRAINALMQRVHTAIEREQRFTSDAAHELRSPLAALKVQAEVLALSTAPEEQAHHLASIQASIERAQRLTDQLLVLARIDPLTTLPEREPIDWPALAASVLQSVNLQAREKRITLRLEGAEHAAAVRPQQGNPLLLQLMLRNLLDNAIRYSPEGSSVTLSLGPGAISVCDQGAGIAPEHLPRIRERFYRPAGQAEQGSGLGLAIVETIAALHGLAVQLDSRPGSGLCVRLRP